MMNDSTAFFFIHTLLAFLFFNVEYAFHLMVSLWSFIWCLLLFYDCARGSLLFYCNADVFIYGSCPRASVIFRRYNPLITFFAYCLSSALLLV